MKLVRVALLAALVGVLALVATGLTGASGGGQHESNLWGWPSCCGLPD
ncbi:MULTISPECIES: hypothetical protein [unclassified Solwaraspora]|nr:hypothetical protein [Solwaraspora sp. WMMA2056]WJK39193.1 hypothetical protein O7608_22330 [Solwaraspora sp. WMMA2056]